MNVASLPPLDELVPHRGIMLLLDRLLAYDETTTTCSVALEEQRWLKDADGRVASWLTVEYMAQCMAAHESITAWLAGHPADIGLVAAVSNLSFHVPILDPGRPLRVRASRLRGSRELKAFSHACSVFDAGDEIVAEGRLTLALQIPEPKTSS